MKQKHRYISIILAVLMLTMSLPAIAFAAPVYTFSTSVSGMQVTITGTVYENNSPSVGDDVTLRIEDSQSRSILVDQKKSGVNGAYSFGAYTLTPSSYTAYVGGTGTPQSKAFTVASSSGSSGSGSSGSSGSGSSGPSTPAPTTSATNTSVTATTKVTTEQVAGQTVAKVTVDEVAALKSVTDNKAGALVINVNQTADVAQVQLTGDFITKTAQANVSLKVQSGNGSYTLPAQEIKLSEVAQKLGVSANDVKITVVIASLKTDEVATIKENANKQGLILVGAPLVFKIEATAGDKKVEVNNFSTYVSRGINLPGSVEGNRTVGAVKNYDGTLSPVPTQFSQEGGKWVAEIKRKSNSTYMVVTQNKSFADVKSHWAKEDIDILASKLIINGMNEKEFMPEGKVTRAQLASIIVRSLGLTGNSTSVKFSDVNNSDWYAGVIGAAVDAGIVSGYKDNTFKPNAFVTKEETAAMVVRAMNFAGDDTNIAADEVNQQLTKLADGSKINDWAKSAVAVAVKKGVIQGNEKKIFAPKGNSSRAEATVMIKKMLTTVKFI